MSDSPSWAVRLPDLSQRDRTARSAAFTARISGTGHHWCGTENAPSRAPRALRRTLRALAQIIAGPATASIGGSACPGILRGLAAGVLQADRSERMCP